MFMNYCILNIFDYICAQNAQCWARITKSNMEIQRYNRLKIVLVIKITYVLISFRTENGAFCVKINSIISIKLIFCYLCNIKQK